MQKSEDGNGYYSIGSLNVQQGVYNYSYTDNNVSPGLHFYRIRYVLKNGRYYYSKVVKLQIEEDLGLSLYPNPIKAGKEISVYIQKPNNNDFSVSFIDINGKVIRTKNYSLLSNAGSITIPTDFIKPGIYILRVHPIGSKEDFIEKVVVLPD